MKTPTQIAAEAAEKIVALTGYGHALHVNDIIPDILTAIQQATEEGAREKIAPVQGYAAGIPWSMHLRAYDVYCKRYGAQEAMITGWCRGGFAVSELDMFIPGWRDELAEVEKLKAQLRDLTDQLAARDGVLARLKEALENMVDLWKRSCAPRVIERDSQVKEARAALVLTPATYADKLREAEAELAIYRKPIAIIPDDGQPHLVETATTTRVQNELLRAELTALRGLLERAEIQFEKLLDVAPAYDGFYQDARNVLKEISARLATERKEDGKS